jgi:hypothetical protein
MPTSTKTDPFGPGMRVIDSFLVFTPSDSKFILAIEEESTRCVTSFTFLLSIVTPITMAWFFEKAGALLVTFIFGLVIPTMLNPV